MLVSYGSPEEGMLLFGVFYLGWDLGHQMKRENFPETFFSINEF
jgi:hypothetical protein